MIAKDVVTLPPEEQEDLAHALALSMLSASVLAALPPRDTLVAILRRVYSYGDYILPLQVGGLTLYDAAERLADDLRDIVGRTDHRVRRGVSASRFIANEDHL